MHCKAFDFYSPKGILKANVLLASFFSSVSSVKLACEQASRGGRGEGGGGGGRRKGLLAVDFSLDSPQSFAHN